MDHPPSPPSYRQVLYDALRSDIDRPTTALAFATGGEICSSIGTPIIRFHQHSIGNLHYPLRQQQAVEIIQQIAQPATYSRSSGSDATDLIHDTQVRQAWQVDSDHFHVDERWMKESLGKLVDQVMQDLGIATGTDDAGSTCSSNSRQARVEAHLCMMLLYEEGGHFERHSDSEKEAGMFGTLLIQLPAGHEGGELLVEHNGMQQNFAYARESADKSFYTAFYADCDHSLSTVSSGHRLVLVFNLVRVDGEMMTSLGNGDVCNDLNATSLNAIRDAVKAWQDDVCKDDSAAALLNLALPLEYKYSEESLRFHALKGNDIVTVNRIRSLRDADGKAMFRVYLLILAKRLKDADERRDIPAYTDHVPDVWVDEEGKVSRREQLEDSHRSEACLEGYDCLEVAFPEEVLVDDPRNASSYE
jgi:hypothetical protein